MSRFKIVALLIMASFFILSTGKCIFAQDAPAQDVTVIDEAVGDFTLEETQADAGALPIEEGIADEQETPVSELKEGMAQGLFAKFLIKELGAEGLLPTASTTLDAFKFLESVGCVPPGGWDEEGSITKDELCAMLSQKSCEGSFEELLEKLKKRLAATFWNMGIRVPGSNVIKVLTPTTFPD